jgi:hypothetical protein
MPYVIVGKNNKLLSTTNRTTGLKEWVGREEKEKILFCHDLTTARIWETTTPSATAVERATKENGEWKFTRVE